MTAGLRFPGGRRSRAAALGALLVAAAAAAILFLANDPGVPLLLPEEGAEWVRPDMLFFPGKYDATDLAYLFRARFRTGAAPRSAILTVRAMRASAATLDGQTVLPPSSDLDSWKRPRRVDLAPLLSPGEHELRILGANRQGPVLVLAYCREAGLATGPAWEWSVDGASWGRVLGAGETPPLPVNGLFPTVADAVASWLPLLLPVFFLAFAATLVFHYRRDRLPALVAAAPSASRLRWCLLGAWFVLAANNIGKIPPVVGFDIAGHFRYVEYMARNWRIPLAPEGWQMYQAPLYYIISAAWYSIVGRLADPGTARLALRAVPLLCGLLQVEIAYRAVRRVFPGRDDLQAVGVLVAGLAPMNLYLSQSVSNESLAALFSAAALVALFSLCADPAAPLPRWRLPATGLLIGLALLTKMSALLLLPVAALMTFHGLRGRGWPARRIAAATAEVIGIALLVSGWFYARNAVALGKPFVANWDPEAGMMWWQDPGFRTPGSFLSFGTSLMRPVYSGIYSFWDSLYSTFWTDGYLSGLLGYQSRPPWNFGPMLSGAWLGLLPALGMVSGAALAVAGPKAGNRAAQRFSVAAIGAYLAALLGVFLRVPYYSTGKAFYLLGLLPCFGILAAGGLSPVIGRPWPRAVVFGLLACWAVASYAAYFVV